MNRVNLETNWCGFALVLYLITFNFITLFSQNHFAQNSIPHKFDFEVNVDKIIQQLSFVPSEFDQIQKSSDVFLELPNPEGAFQLFKVEKSSIMDKEGENLYGYQSFKAIHPENGSIVGRFSVSENGLNGIFIGKNRNYVISKEDNSFHQAKYESGNDQVHSCGSEAQKVNFFNSEISSRTNFSFGDQLRVFKIAMTCTGEFGEKAIQKGLRPELILADLVNQVNLIYEKELSIRLQVVTPIIPHTVPERDPFTTTNTLSLLSEAKNAIDNLYAGNDYQLGHLITLFGGGRAYIGSVCRTLKSGAVTGMSIPPSVNNIRLFVHEIGHQFGAGHSFNGKVGHCKTNRFPGSAYEIGSGSTIMSYAGSCHPDNVRNQRSSFFNVGAQSEIYQFLSTQTLCTSFVQKHNTPPSVNNGTTKFIPASTPFILRAAAFDINGDPLTYSWEQFDLESIADANTPIINNKTTPLFKVEAPSNSNERMFPELKAILSGANQGSHEVLSATSRDLNFKIVVRDGKGGISAADQLVKVHNTGKPFKINSFNSNESVPSGSSKTISWEVAGTNQYPIQTPNVDILLSTNGGQSFPYTLAENVINDGNHTIQFPNTTSNDARIMIRGRNNFFFDINDAPIEIGGSIQPNLNISISSSTFQYERNQPITLDINLQNNSNFATQYLQISVPFDSDQLAYVSASSTHGVYNQFSKNWEIISLPAYASANLKLVLLPITGNENISVSASTNNISDQLTLIPKPIVIKPDLLVTNASTSASFQIGTLHNASLIINNIGSSAVNQNFRVGAYLSSDQYFDANDVKIGEGVLSSAKIGANSLNLSLFVANDWGTGSKYVIYNVDDKNEINELNELNNSTATNIQIIGAAPTPRVDLELSSSVSENIITNGSTDVTLVIRNKGGISATNVLIKHYPNLKFVNYSNLGTSVSNGQFNKTNKEWFIPTLPPNATATLVFRQQISDLTIIDKDFFEVISCREDDVDSTPGNGNTYFKTPREDDESAITFQPAPVVDADIELKSSITKSELTEGEIGSVTFYLKNIGTGQTSVTTGIHLNQWNFVSSSAKGGSYNSFTGIWEVNNLNSSGTAELTINFSNYGQTQLSEIPIFAQVTQSTLPDPDSHPNNGVCCVAKEDDETSQTIRLKEEHCGLNTTISNKTCRDNGTPSQEDDFYFFNLKLTNGNSTGEWEATIAGIYHRVSYGQSIQIGPININSGQLTIEAMDVDNESCSAIIRVSPPPSCSVPSSDLDYCDLFSSVPWSEWIAGVQINGFSNLSSKSTYTYFHDKEIQLSTQSINQLWLISGYSWRTHNEYWRAWIDYNQNGVFESTELVFENILGRPLNGVPTKGLGGQFYLGNDKPLGTTRMRVAMSRTGFPEPCGTFVYGEVEDYPVLISNSLEEVEDRTKPQDPAAYIDIYPNPSSKRISIRSDDKIKIIQIIDNTGKLILEEDQKFKEIDISHIATGLYIAKITLNESDQLILKKLVIK